MKNMLVGLSLLAILCVGATAASSDSGSAEAEDPAALEAYRATTLEKLDGLIAWEASTGAALPQPQYQVMFDGAPDAARSALDKRRQLALTSAARLLERRDCAVSAASSMDVAGCFSLTEYRDDSRPLRAAATELSDAWLAALEPTAHATLVQNLAAIADSQRREAILQVRASIEELFLYQKTLNGAARLLRDSVQASTSLSPRDRQLLDEAISVILDRTPDAEKTILHGYACLADASAAQSVDADGQTCTIEMQATLADDNRAFVTKLSSLDKPSEGAMQALAKEAPDVTANLQEVLSLR